jgi:hypothetical protein
MTKQKTKNSLFVTTHNPSHKAHPTFGTTALQYSEHSVLLFKALTLMPITKYHTNKLDFETKQFNLIFNNQNIYKLLDNIKNNENNNTIFI